MGECSVVKRICPVISGRRTFDFVWSKEKNLKLQINQQHTGKKIDIQHQRRACSQCECSWDTSQCPPM